MSSQNADWKKIEERNERSLQEQKKPSAADKNEISEASEGTDDSEFEQQEDPNDYRPGGYHPVTLWNKIHDRYCPVRKLGFGNFSTVWLCWDFKTKQFVALKIQMSNANFTAVAKDEISLLNYVRDADVNDPRRNRIVRLLESFELPGPNGIHVCMAFEMLGDNLLKLIIENKYSGIPMQQIRSITKQLLEALAYLHKCNIIHTDIKPENILLVRTEEETLKLAVEVLSFTQSTKPLPRNARASIEYKNEIVPNVALIRSCSISPSNSSSQAAPVQPVEPNRLVKDSEKSLSLINKLNEPNEKPPPVKKAEVIDIEKSYALSEEKSLKLNKTPAKKTEEKPKEKEPLKEKPKLNEPKEKSSKEKPPIEKKADEIDIEKSYALNDEKSSKLNKATVDKTEEKSKDKVESKKNTPDTSSNEKTSGSRKDNTNKNDSQANIKSRGTESVRDIEIKLVDLGNSCFTHRHYSELVQTRQYRAIEVMLGVYYLPAVDIWSVACMAFELATGSFLFNPQKHDGINKEEDHVCLIVGLLGEVPQNVKRQGKLTLDYYNYNGTLKWPNLVKRKTIKEVLLGEYKWSENRAKEFSEFLLPMLALDPELRLSAEQCLNLPWLTNT